MKRKKCEVGVRGAEIVSNKHWKFYGEKEGKKGGHEKVRANSRKTLATHLGVVRHTVDRFTLPGWKDSLHDRASHCRVHKKAAASRLVFIHRSLSQASAQLGSRGICQTDQTNRAAMNNWVHQCLWLKERWEAETQRGTWKTKRKEDWKMVKMSNRCSFCLSWFHAVF